MKHEKKDPSSSMAPPLHVSRAETKTFVEAVYRSVGKRLQKKQKIWGIGKTVVLGFLLGFFLFCSVLFFVFVVVYFTNMVRH